MKIAFLNALRAFEVSCRRQSFSAAAQELNVTPAAVGQLVKSLEEYIGEPLFVRQTGGKARLRPSEKALQALPDIQAGFAHLADGLAKLKNPVDDSVLNITASPAFAGKWLLPRLEHFQTAYPEIDVLLNTNAQSVNLLAEHIDIGIRYGNGNWKGLAAEKWQDETLFPVCSPHFLSTHAIRSPGDLLNLPLIHDISMPSESGFPGWNDWFASRLPMPVPVPVRGLRINNSASVLQAAADGQGVVLARSLMAADDLRAGRLVRLFPEIQCIGAPAYYLVCRPDCADLKKIRAFRDWMMAQKEALPVTPA